MKTRDRLVGCALEELEKGGVEAFSLRSVSAAAGVTPMAVYRHFPNKDELLQAAGSAAFAAWQARVETIRATEPLEWLRQAARLFMQFALDEPARFDACFVIRTGVERKYPRDFRAGKSPVVSMMLERVVAAQASGRLAPADPLEITMFFWSQLHGLAMLQRSGRFAMSRSAFLALAARLSEHAIASFRANGMEDRA
ncbi:MAG TPA: TetR/AcrR family transcriptional regulator [Steroidobacteraceae bacterium]|jgi:AcrR family transcriptional regulator|nr:TetR/AcrR family transcriptional regulator [Steroidobacteraceae bacterium]